MTNTQIHIFSSFFTLLWMRISSLYLLFCGRPHTPNQSCIVCLSTLKCICCMFFLFFFVFFSLSDVQSYSGSHVLILSSQDIACFIGQILGGVSHEFTIKINVHCKCGKHKDVKMKLIPHKEHHVKSVTLEACLHMPKKCSRHKWLVYFAHSHLHVHTSVTTSEGQEICTASKATPILPMDIPSGHNLTHVTVATVIPMT